MNSSRLAILTLVLGLGIGFGIGLLKGDAGLGVVDAAGPSGPEPSAPGPRSHSQAEDATTTLAAVSDSAPSKSSGTTPGGPAVSAEATRLAQRVSVAAKGSTTDTSTWNGVIRGSVLNELGEPIIGATVLSKNNYRNSRTRLSTSTTNRVGRAYKGPSDIEDSVAKSAESQLKARRNTRTATSATDGQFELSGLKSGTHRLSVYAEGYTFNAGEHEVGATIEIIGKPVTVLTLDIRLPDGTVPEEAVVAITGSRNNSQNYKWTSANPELRLYTGNIEFRVYSGHVRRLEWSETIADFMSKDQSLSFDRDGEGPHLIQLEASQLCQVNVTDTSGMTPIIRPWVKIVNTDQRTGGDIDWTKDNAIELTREEGGQYSAKDLPAGSYTVGLGRGGNEPEVTEPLQVLAGLTTLDVTLGELELSRFLIATCTGPNGRPVNDVSFKSTAQQKEGGSTSGGADALKRGQGVYWIAADKLLHGKTWDDMASVHLTVTSKDYGTMEMDITEGQKELSLAFVMPCELIVFVSGDHSAGYRATITEHKDDDSDPMHRYYSFTGDGNSKKVDTDGRALFTGKQPGKYEVTLTKTGHGDDRFSGWDKPTACKEVVTLREGTNEVTLALPSFHSLTVFAPGQRKGSNFQLTPEGSKEEDYFAGRRGELGEDERVTFEDVPAGTYILKSWTSQGSNMTVTVPCGEVTFEVKEANCLKVTNVQAGKAGAEAGLKNGDLITAIDGEPLKGQMAMQMATMKIMTAEVSLTVRRGNTNMNIQIGPLGQTPEAMANLGFRARPHTID